MNNPGRQVEIDIADALFVSVAVFFVSVRIADKYVEMKKAKALKVQQRKEKSVN